MYIRRPKKLTCAHCGQGKLVLIPVGKTNITTYLCIPCIEDLRRKSITYQVLHDKMDRATLT